MSDTEGLQHIETLSAWGGDIFPKLSWFKQEKVAAARVMVVGCGALGNEVLKNLVLFGIRHLVVVDFDQVEESNLSRSVFYRKADAEAYRYKVDVIAERLREINPDVEVKTIRGDIAYDVGLALLKGMNVVVGCVDSRWARYAINRLCMRAGIPWVDGGIESLEGTVRVFAPGENCYACNLGPEGLKELRRRMPCSGIIRRNEAAGRVPTTPIVASVIGAVEVQEVLKLIHQEEMENGELTSLCGKVFYYEGQHLTTEIAQFKAYDDDCPVHEKWEDIRSAELSKETIVGDALQQMRQELQTEEVAIVLTNDCFVDYVEDKSSCARVQVMCPGHMVASRVEENESLRQRPFGALYQHEYRRIDDKFPYVRLTLGDLGVPSQDVLHVSIPGGDYYMAMNN